MICTPIGIGSQRDRHRDHRQADEGDRLGVDADIGAHRQFDAVEHEGRLPEFRRDAGRRRRDDHVDRLEQLQHLRAIPAAEFLRAVDQRRRHHRARQQAVAHRRIEIVRPLAQPVEMQRGALGGGDDIGRGAGARGFGNLDRRCGAERLCDAGDGFDGFREHVLLEIAAGDRDPQAADVLRQQRAHRLDGRVVQAASSASGPCIAS